MYSENSGIGSITQDYQTPPLKGYYLTLLIYLFETNFSLQEMLVSSYQEFMIVTFCSMPENTFRPGGSSTVGRTPELQGL